MGVPVVPDPPAADDPTELRQYRAWELHVEGRSLAYIGERLGTSRTTAHRDVAAGRDLAAQLDYLDHRRERETAAAVMELVRSWMVDEVTRGGDAILASHVVIKAEERRAKLLGLDAPTRIAVRDDRARPAPTVPGEVVDAVAAYRTERARGEIGA